MAGSSSLLREYVWFEGKPVAVVEGGVVYFVRTDHIGRPVFATDGTGAKVWEATYLPFGGVHTSSGSPIALRFPGQWFQSESGLFQNWMRDYDPTTGRYLQADPFGLVDGASVYGYVGQNPGRWTDRTGLCGEGLCVGGGIALYRLYRIYRTGRAVGEAVAGAPGAAGTAAATSNSASSEGEEAKDRAVAETGEMCKYDDDCKQLYSDIYTTTEEIKKRFRQWRRDRNRLIAGEPARNRRSGTYSGHVYAIWGNQKRLQNLIGLAKTRGCLDYHPEADDYASRPVPFPGSVGGQ